MQLFMLQEQEADGHEMRRTGGARAAGGLGRCYEINRYRRDVDFVNRFPFFPWFSFFLLRMFVSD